jgi:ZIP family zinc transporter
MIPGYLIAALWGAIGSVALLVGSFFGYKYNIPKKVMAMLTAFSSGILISAVCFELLFEAYSYGDIYQTTIGFLTGVIAFTLIDALIHRHSVEKYKEDYESNISKMMNTQNRPNRNMDDINDLNIIKHRYTRYFNKYQVQSLTTLAGALLDGVPEAVAIGLTFFIGGPISIALLFAVLIANTFEGATASLNMKLGGWSGKNILGIWILVIILTAVSATLSYIIFSHTDKHVISIALGVAGGALLAMIADTMLPEAYDEMQEWTGLVMALGFLLSFILSHLQLH